MSNKGKMMESAIVPNRVIEEVGGYEIWIPDADTIAAWELQYDATFSTCNCIVGQLLYHPGATENDPQLGKSRLIVPVVKQVAGKFKVLRNAESIAMVLTPFIRTFPALRIND